MSHVFAALDRDWADFARSRRSRDAIRRWHAAGLIEDMANVDVLVAAMQDDIDLDARNALVWRLVGAARTDGDACTTVLRAVCPGLVRLTRTYCRYWGWQETASMTVTAAVERILTYPLRRRERPAANIVRDVHHVLWRARNAEAAAVGSLESAPGATSPADRESDRCCSAGEQLLALVDEAVENWALSPERARLVVLHRIFDVDSDQLARRESRCVDTVRKQRQRAEAKLAHFARRRVA